MADTTSHRSASTIPDNAPAPAKPSQGGAQLLRFAPHAGDGVAQAEHRPLHKSPNNRGFMPTLLGTAVFFISFAAAVALTLYSVGAQDAGAAGSGTGAASASLGLWSWWGEWRHIASPVTAALVTLLAGMLFALFNFEFSQPDRVDPQLYGELRTRLGSLDALLPVLCPSSGPTICDLPSATTCIASCNEAWARRDFINDELASRGSRWVRGSGFVDIYRQLHAAEAALFIVQPASDLLANALCDDLRLKGAEATIPNAASLRVNLKRAVPLLGCGGVEFLSSDCQDERPEIVPTPENRAVGRVVLRDVRRAISEFRDGERANLVRARNQLICTGTITAVAGYTLLALAMLARAPWEAVLSGVVFYVVGAGVGLFSQLRVDQDRESGHEDFGFSRARLFYMPVLSGLAAVGGVMVVALLYEAINFRPDEPQRSLEEVFNVRAFSLGLVIAAVFGLTPGLLVERLEAKATDYRKALKLTSAATGGAPATA